MIAATCGGGVFEEFLEVCLSYLYARAASVTSVTHHSTAAVREKKGQEREGMARTKLYTTNER